MTLRKHNFGWELLVFLFIIFCWANCSVVQAQVDTGFFKHVNKQDSSSIYLRFVAVDLPDNETGYVVETYRIYENRRCAFMHNDVEWTEDSMVLKTSGEKWQIDFDLETETLTVNFPHSTSVFFRTDDNPASYCFSQKRTI